MFSMNREYRNAYDEFIMKHIRINTYDDMSINFN